MSQPHLLLTVVASCCFSVTFAQVPSKTTNHQAISLEQTVEKPVKAAPAPVSQRPFTNLPQVAKQKKVTSISPARKKEVTRKAEPDEPLERKD